MKLSFYGGAKSVTGANYLLESGNVKILIDCGLRQGSGFCELGNWDEFSYNPKEIAAVFVTHSHIDHIGRLPKLYKEGFRGEVYSTPPTRDFAEVMLLDSDNILEQESKRCKKPSIYNQEDVYNLVRLWKTVEYHRTIEVGPFKITFYNAGHILGSAFILIEAEGKKIVFSGDLGNSPAPIIGDKDNLPETDYCLIESTYGGRIHEDLPKRKELIEDIIEETAKKGGVLMIPAFAMERTQDLLYEIDSLVENGRIPSVPVFLDSPLAIKLTEIYKTHDKYFIPEAREHLMKEGHIFKFKGLKMTMRTEESIAINDVPAPKVIIAGSGMMHGGRILHHVKRYLSDNKSTLLIVGYQGKGSLGRRILDGESIVKIHREEVQVKARIEAIGGYSAHADQPQLIDWLRQMRKRLKKVFTVQGEEDQANALINKIQDELAIEAELPEPNQEMML